MESVATMRRYYSIPRILYYLRALRKNTWLKASELRKIQEKKLRANVKHAYENVRFYHQKFDSVRIKPDDIKTVDDLDKLPIITKSDIQKNFHEFIAKDVRIEKCHLDHTSGSTGRPLTVIFDEKAFDFIQANELRRFIECGGRFRDKWAIYTGFRPAGSSRRFLFEYFGLFRRRHFSWDIASSLPSLKKYQPDVISGYPSLLELLARAIKKEEITIQPRLIFSGGEVLGKTRRKFINSTFETEMFTLYGCVESGMDIAWECTEHKYYHIDVDADVVEFVKDGERVAPGEEGEIVFTTLFNYAMPLIRYNVKDVGVPSEEECPCGRELPLMEMISGRADDFIVLPSGRIVTSLSIWDSEAFPRMEGISRYKIIQERLDEFRIQLVLDEGYSQDIVDQFEKGFRKALNEEYIKVKIDILNAIPRDKSGKIRRIVSKVSPYQHHN